jgi:probable F420-dependent oxidoreductase
MPGRGEYLGDWTRVGGRKRGAPGNWSCSRIRLRHSLSMDLGIVVMIGSDGLTPQAVGRACEERGFESLFWAEHTHIPVRSLRADGASTRWYADTYDPFTALSAAAAVTSTLKLGTGVCLVIERDPITLAKEVASLDRLSGGRFLFGVGAGWNREEMADHGTEPRTRMALLADRVRAMREIWANDEASYHGQFVDFDPLWSWPKPAQRPGPPVLVAGNGPGSEDRVLDFGDQWMPQSGPFADVAEFRRRVAALRRRAQDAGREPIPVTVFGVPPDRALLAEFAEAGADRCLLPLTSLDASETMSKLDDWAALRSESSRLPRSARPRECETPAGRPVASAQALARACADHPPLRPAAHQRQRASSRP